MQIGGRGRRGSRTGDDLVVAPTSGGCGACVTAPSRRVLWFCPVSRVVPAQAETARPARRPGRVFRRSRHRFNAAWFDATRAQLPDHRIYRQPSRCSRFFQWHVSTIDGYTEACCQHGRSSSILHGGRGPYHAFQRDAHSHCTAQHIFSHRGRERRNCHRKCTTAWRCSLSL